LAERLHIRVVIDATLTERNHVISYRRDRRASLRHTAPAERLARKERRASRLQLPTSQTDYRATIGIPSMPLIRT